MAIVPLLKIGLIIELAPPQLSLKLIIPKVCTYVDAALEPFSHLEIVLVGRQSG